MSAAFELNDVSYRYAGASADAVTNATLTIARGSFCALIGPNGSGKSTLLRLMLGTLQPSSGTVRFDGRDVRTWSRRDLARRIGVVPQSEELAFSFSVREIVAMGRYPHLGAWTPERRHDRDAILNALDICDVRAFIDRPLSTLSGGERQRARIARALAQEPDTLVLDEPTAALDIRHEMQIFEILRTLCAGGVTVVVVTHHINLAARYAAQLVVLDKGRVAADGLPQSVLQQELIERVYEWPVLVQPYPGAGPDAGAPQVTPAGAPPRP